MSRHYNILMKYHGALAELSLVHCVRGEEHPVFFRRCVQGEEPGNEARLNSQ